MALTGVHVACGYIGAKGAFSSVPALLAKLLWSQTMASAGMTALAAPGKDAGDDTLGAASFEIRSAIDVFVAIGANPDATNGPRIFVPAGFTRNIFCGLNDKLAWIAA